MLKLTQKKQGLSSGSKLLLSFLILFSAYHVAEYMIMFRNNPVLFFTFQILFFISAFVLGNWYSGKGLAAWGLPFSKKVFNALIFGILLGILLYGIPFSLSLFLRIERMISIPSFGVVVQSSLPFAIGVVLTSFSEDILTRGLVFAHFRDKLKPVLLAVLSAAIYLLNHIYRLGDGFDVLAYLFLLGIIFMLPLLITKNLWITGGVHWAGNLFFFITHEVMQTQPGTGFLSYNYFFALCLLFMIPLIWILMKKFTERFGSQPGF